MTLTDSHSAVMIPHNTVNVLDSIIDGDFHKDGGDLTNDETKTGTI